MFNKRSISPLIATILLIVVSVILVTVILTWGSDFTKKALDQSIIEDSSYIGLITAKPVGINNLYLNTSFNFPKTEIIGYKIIPSLDHPISHLLEEKVYSFDTPIELAPNSSTLITIDCFPERKFNLSLITSNNTYITLEINTKNINTYLGCIEPNCKNYKDKFDPEDGIYLISSQIGADYNVYCDMTTDGGGWTLVTNIVDTINNNIPNDIEEVRAGWTEVSDGLLTNFTGAKSYDLSYFIGTSNLDMFDPSNIKICAIKTKNDKRCYWNQILQSHYTFTGAPYVSSNNNFVKMASVLSGTVEYGKTIDGANGKFLNYALTLFRGDSYSSGGYIQQWSGDTANWHVWGLGVTQTNSFTNDREIYNNGANDSGQLREYTAGWEVWLR